MCGNHFKIGEVIKGKLIEKSIAKLIQGKHPKWSSTGYICLADLNLFRTQYVTKVLKDASQEVYDLEKGMAKSLEEEELVSRNINKEFESSLTLGERLADRLADFGGSWTFISIFMTVLIIWMAINTWILLTRPFRSLSLHPSQPRSLLSGGDSGTGYFDEPESPRGQGPPSV